MSSKRIDVIIVLGGAIDTKGELSDFVKTRVEKAVSKSDGKIPIILSGKYSFLISFVPPITESEAMAKYAKSLDNNALIYIENQSMDTIGNAYFSKTMFVEKNDWKNILVITSEFHAKRSLYIFKKVYGKKYEVKMEKIPSNLSKSELDAKQKLETKLLRFTRIFLTPVINGNNTEVRDIMNLFPEYTLKPKFSKKTLIKMVKEGTEKADTYGIKSKTQA